MWFFSPQQETFNSIFFINSWFIHDYSFILIIGILFLILVIVFLLVRRYFLQFGFRPLIWIVIFCWLISFLNPFYNNWYDVADNFKVSDLSIEQKRLNRVYNFERSQGTDYTYYDILNFLLEVETAIPRGSFVYYIIPFALNPYFYYNTYPNYKPSIILDKIDYIVLYFSQDGYFYNDKHLYRIEEEDYIDLGAYDLVKILDGNRVIFKRIK